MAISTKVACLLAVILGAAVLAEAGPRSLTQFVTPDANALDNGSPYDALWICSVFGSGNPKYGDCGSNKAQTQFTNLAKSIVPSNQWVLKSIQMMGVPVGCCFQMDINGTSANSTASDKAFAFLSNGPHGLNTAATHTGIANWAKTNGVCGPNAAISFVVGWDIYTPLKAKYFGCNIGTLGVKLNSLCRC